MKTTLMFFALLVASFACSGQCDPYKICAILIKEIEGIDVSKYNIDLSIDDKYVEGYTMGLGGLDYKTDIAKCIKEKRCDLDKDLMNKSKVKIRLSSPFKNNHQVIIFKSTLFMVSDNQVKGGILQKLIFKFKENTLESYREIDLKEY